MAKKRSKKQYRWVVECRAPHEKSWSESFWSRDNLTRVVRRAQKALIITLSPNYGRRREARPHCFYGKKP